MNVVTSNVIYACHCLNIKIYLSNKYQLEGHEALRKEKYVELDNPAVSGWKFGLGMNGVSVEYRNLISMKKLSDDWVTVGCFNCKTEKVYSVKRKYINIEYPVDLSSLSKFGDQAIIHKGTIFGQEVENLKKSKKFSNTFKIVLNDDSSIHHKLFLEKDEISPQYKELKQIIKKSLFELEEAAEKRIQDYQKQQEALLTRDREKAIYDGYVLWKTMKEALKDVQPTERRKSSPNILSHHFEELPKENRRKSSAMKQEFLNTPFPPIFYRRRSSHALGESDTSVSFTGPNPTLLVDPAQEAPSTVLVSNENSLHPLSALPELSNTDAPTRQTNDDESDHLFELDEDADVLNRKQSTKYIDSEEDEFECSTETEAVSDYLDPNTIYNFGTSVPIAISYSNATPIIDENEMSDISIKTMPKLERRASFIGFDYAAADRRQSLNFSPIVDKNRRPSINSEESNSSSDLDEGPIVPPHLLVNNTSVNDLIFGSIPRNSIRNRCLE